MTSIETSLETQATASPRNPNSGSVLSPILSFLGLFLTSLGLFANAIVWQTQNYTREQDHQLDYLHGLAGRLYDYEKDKPRVLCLYGQPSTSAFNCNDEDLSLTETTLPYVELVIDLVLEDLSYQRRWKDARGLFADAVRDEAQYCLLRDEVLRDPHGVFRSVAAARFGDQSNPLSEMGPCIDQT